MDAVPMNKYIAITGVILLLLAAFFFYADFNNGGVGSLVFAGSKVAPTIVNFAAFIFAIIFLPIGSGLAFVGFSYRGPAMRAQGGAQAASGVVSTGSGVAKAALAVAIIAILVSAGTLAAVIAVSGQVSTLSSKPSGTTTSSIPAAVAGGEFNQTPSAVAYKVDWCNTDNSGQDRFCPNQLTVVQGDVVEILFISNDTDIHTFTLVTPPYNFQINATAPGMHDFLTNGNVAGGCSNNGTFSEISAGVSGTYCVSGSSLLSNSSLNSLTGSNTFPIAQNPTPGLPLNGTTPLLLPVNNQVNDVNASAAAQASGTTEIWGIGAFQATQPGIYEFFCHYHVSNGMFGYLVVLPNAYCTTDPSACGVSNSTST